MKRYKSAHILIGAACICGSAGSVGVARVSRPLLVWGCIISVSSTGCLIGPKGIVRVCRAGSIRGVAQRSSRLLIVENILQESLAV